MVIVDVALSVVSSPDFNMFIENLAKATDTKITVYTAAYMKPQEEGRPL